MEQAGHGVSQYVILGAGPDAFALSRPEMLAACGYSRSTSGAQAWKADA